MSTYQLSTVRSRIQDRLDNTSFSTSKLTQFINDSQREIIIQAKPQYAQLEATYTTAISANTLTTTATDVLVPLSFKLFTPINYAMKLPFIEYQDVDLFYPNVGLLGTGPPIAWSVFGGTPFLVNNADAVYTLKGKYLQTPPELTNDTDVPILPVTFSEILVLAGYKRALEHDDDFDSAQVVQQEIDSKILDMTSILKPQLGAVHVMRQPLTRRRFGNR